MIAKQSGEPLVGEAVFVRLVLQRPRQIWKRRKCTVSFDVRKFRRKIGHYLLDQKTSEGNASQTLQAIADRIENCGVALLGSDDRRMDIQQRGKVARQTLGERHLHEDDWFIRQRRMEKCVAP